VRGKREAAGRGKVGEEKGSMYRKGGPKKEKKKNGGGKKRRDCSETRRDCSYGGKAKNTPTTKKGQQIRKGKGL